MKNSFKLIVVVLLLIIANLFVYEGVILTKTYANLIVDYNKLLLDYNELEAKYTEQESYLAQIEANLKEGNISIDNNRGKDSLRKILDSIDLNKIKDFIGNFNIN